MSAGLAQAGEEAELRAALVAAGRRMVACGLTHGASGNLSARAGDGFLITPSGVPYDRIEAVDLVHIALDGGRTGRREPSSEWRFHRDLYRARPAIRAIVHAHSPYATALACTRRSIPAFHYMVAAAGGDSVPCAPYATFGTQALSDIVVAALAERDACLVANHGMIAVGADLDAAYRLAETVEEMARLYWMTLAVGGPVVLDSGEMAAVAERFATYGQKPAGAEQMGSE